MAGIFDTGIFDTGIFDHFAGEVEQPQDDGGAFRRFKPFVPPLPVRNVTDARV